MTSPFAPASATAASATDAPAPDAPAAAVPASAAPVTGSSVVALEPSASPRGTSFHAAPAPAELETIVPVDAPARRPTPDGYVVFAVGPSSYAVPVEEVGSVLRPDHLELLASAQRPRYGRGVALVDVRGRAIPVVDLRADPDLPGEVLLPLYRHHVGLVVDRVVAVRPAEDLVPEPDGLPDVLPEYAQGILRPVDGGPHLLLVGMPDAAALEPAAT